MAADLREELLALPGVVWAELEGDPVAPAAVRLGLAPHAATEEVRARVDEVLARHGLRAEPVATTVPVRTRRVAEGLRAVAVEEGTDGVVVRALGDLGGEATRRAHPARVDEALVRAVAALAGAEVEPVVLSVEERSVVGVPLLTVVLDTGGGPAVGSAVVVGGRHYALGRAVWAALSDRAISSTMTSVRAGVTGTSGSEPSLGSG